MNQSNHCNATYNITVKLSKHFLFVTSEDIKMRDKVARLQLSGKVKAFLNLNWSYSMIIRHLKKEREFISKAMISKIKNGKVGGKKINGSVEKRGRPSKLQTSQLKRLKQMVVRPDPPTQRAMAVSMNISQSSINYIIKKLQLKMVKKPKCHHLSESSIEKRRKRSWPLYVMLRGERWKKFVTSDEAWFYLTNSQGKRNVHYISRTGSRKDCEIFSKQSHPKGVMVWAALSSRGVLKPIFVEPGAKINAVYYINKILKPFIRDVKRFYPDGQYVFHQDSAPSHAAKKTLQYLKEQKVVFIPPEKWLPNSPDAAPCNFFLWGCLKNRVNKRKVKTLSGLKKAIQDELQKIPRDMINRALISWPKRCRKIYYAKGGQIEKHN